MSRVSVINRRTLLRGLGGSVLALPALEIMGHRPARAGAATPPKRFVLMYAGMSLVSDGYPDDIVPNTVGVGYDLKRAALALGTGALPSNPGVGGNGFDVRDHVSIVSGMTIPWSNAEGSSVPPGGRSPAFHFNTTGPQTCGVRGNPTRAEPANGPTADQLVHEAIGEGTSSLSYRVQAASYVGANSTGGSAMRLSYRRSRGGELEAIEPVASPQLAYSTLFGNFVPPDPAEAQAFARRLARHRSVVELVRGNAESLRDRLGSSDRERFDRHLEEVRALEQRLDSLPPDALASCTKPPDPGDDPPIQGSAIEYQGQGGDGVGYSNETLRGELLCDFVRMAFACDLSRVAAIRLTSSQTHMQVGPMLGHEGDIHSAIGHSARPEAYADCVGWHVKHFARLIALLRDTKEYDNSSLLDHTAVILLFEGGSGFDPEGGASDSAHSSENMIALVGGHAGGLNTGGGKHIVFTDGHPANAVVSCMAAVGAAPDETLGDIHGVIPELFG